MTAAVRSFPGLDAAPEGHFTDFVMPMVVESVLAAKRSVEAGRDLTDEEIAQTIVPLTEYYTEQRVPLRALISGGFAVIAAALEEAFETARPEDLADVLALNRFMLDYVGRAMVILFEAHPDIERSVYRIERHARRALCAALVSGAPFAALAVQADMMVPERFDLIALHVATTAVTDPKFANNLSRRRVDLVQLELDQIAGTTALHTFDGRAGVALLPFDEQPPDPVHLQQLAVNLTTHLGEPVIMIDYGSVSRDDLPSASTQALEFAQLAAGLGRPAGLYGTDDLLLEYQLVRPGRVRDRLAARIRPLLSQKHLLEALEAHVRHGWDRQRAAEEIHLHPNSLTYRLRRIAEITGLNPLHPHESRMLAAALIIHRLYPASAALDERPA